MMMRLLLKGFGSCEVDLLQACAVVRLTFGSIALLDVR